MSELIFSVFFFCLGVLFFAFFGHLIWLIITAVFNALFAFRCPRCGAMISNGPCAKCAKVQRRRQSEQWEALAKNLLSENQDKQGLATVQRLVASSRSEQWFTPEEHADLERLLGRLADRLADQSVESGSQAAQSPEHEASQPTPDASSQLASPIPVAASPNQPAPPSSTTRNQPNAASKSHETVARSRESATSSVVDPPIVETTASVPAHPLERQYAEPAGAHIQDSSAAQC